MRQIFSILAFILLAASVFAQSPNTPPILFSSRFQITNAVNGTGDTIVISGYTDDCTTRFGNSDIAIGDSLYVLEGTDLLIFGVVTTRTISLGIATFKVRDFNGAGLLPSNGQAAIFRPTTDYDFPGYVCGLNDGLQQYISDRFRQNLDAALAAGSTDSTIYATVYSRDSSAAAIRGEIAALAQPPFDSTDIAAGGLGITDASDALITHIRQPGVDSLAAHRTDINNLQTLSGRPDGSTHLGTMAQGTQYPDNLNIKTFADSTDAKLTRIKYELRDTIAQTSHGFTVGKLLNIQSGTGAGQLADADVDSLFAVGMVVEVINANTYVLQVGGIATVSGAVIGQQYYLSSTAGDATTTAPAKIQVVYQGIAANTVRIVCDRFSQGLATTYLTSVARDETLIGAGTSADPLAVDTSIFVTQADLNAAVIGSGASGVVTYNGRTGTVNPASGDYTAALVTSAAGGNLATGTVREHITDLDYRAELMETGYIDTFNVGRDTAVTGSTSTNNRTFVLNYPAEGAGYVKELRFYAVAAGTIKIKRFKKPAGDFVFQDEISVTVGSSGYKVVNLNAGLWFDSLDYIAVFNGATSIIAFTGSTTPNPTNYFSQTGDETGTFTPAAVVTSTRLELGFTFAYKPISIEEVAADASSALGQITALGPNALPETIFSFRGVQREYSDTLVYGYSTITTGTTTLSTSQTFFDVYNPFLHDGVIDSFSCYANASGTLKLKFARRIEGAWEIYQTISLTVASGLNTFNSEDLGTAEVEEGSIIGFYNATGLLRYSTSLGRNYMRNASGEATTTFVPVYVDTRLKFQYNLHVVQVDVEKDGVKEYMDDEQFAADTIPPTFRATNWWFDGDNAKNTTTGLANALESNQESYISETLFRTDFKFSTNTSQILFFRRPVIGNTRGTIVEVDRANSRLKFLATWSGSNTIPAGADSMSITLTLDTIRSYRLELQKSYKLITAILYDLKSGASDTLQYNDHPTDVIGMSYGRPGVAVRAGGVIVERMSFFVPQKKKKIKALFMGDSITEGTGATTVADNWANLAIAAIADTNALKSCRGGENSTGILRMLYRELFYVEPQYVVVLIGTNDSSDTTLWKSNMDAFVEFCVQMKVIPIVCCVPAETSDATPVVMNNYILAQGWKTARFDLVLTTGNDGVTRNASLFADTLHPNDAGYLAMFRRLKLDQPEIFD